MWILLPFFQIECSSIAEYSEKIIANNHLDKGRVMAQQLFNYS